jgi:hypothetical protein
MFDVLAPPTAFIVRDSVLVAVGDSGAVVMPIAAAQRSLQANALRRQARGLAGLSVVELDVSKSRMLLGSANALYASPLAGGPAERLLSGVIRAIAVGATPGTWAVARGEWIVVQRAEGSRDSLQIKGGAAALAYDARRALWWAGTDSGVVAIRDAERDSTGASRLTIVRRLDTPAPVRALAHGPRWIVAALGEWGAMGWRDDTGAPTAVTATPTVLRGSPRFVYDVAIQNDRLWIAGGSDGLIRVALDAEWRILGSTRDRGSIVGVQPAADNVVWVSELGQRRLRRLTIIP